MNELWASFVFFFAVIDPFGTIPVFIALTRHHSELERRYIALRATLFAAGILVFFIVAFEFILTSMQIPLAAFQIAGGSVLFLFALTMIFGESKQEEEIRSALTAKEVAIFPLAVPSLASPGALLTAVILTDNDRYNFWEQLVTTLVMFTVLLVALLLMLFASRIHRWIGDSGASVISRIMGLVLSSVAVASMLEGIRIYFLLE